MPSRIRTRHFGAALTALTLACLFGSAQAEGWRYPDEPCRWTAKGTATEEWFTTSAEVVTIQVIVWGGGGGSHFDSDEEEITLVAATSGLVEYRMRVSATGWRHGTSAQASIRDVDYISASEGESFTRVDSFSVNEEETVYARVSAEATEENIASAEISLNHVWRFDHEAARTALEGPATATVNALESPKYMGTFTPQPVALEGGTLGPVTYSLIDDAPPARGSVWIEPDGSIYAETTAIRTWDLLVLSRNPWFGVNIDAAPADNDGETSGSTPFICTYDDGTAVALSAPPDALLSPFSHWEDGAGTVLGTSPTIQTTLDGDKTLTAVYRVRPTFVLTQPTGSTIWQSGTGGEVCFAAIDLPAPSQVILELWRDSGQIAYRRRFACHEGGNVVAMNLPPGIPPGSYHLRLYWAELPSVNARSENFTVTASPAFGIDWPTTGTYWPPGSQGDVIVQAVNLPAPSEAILELWTPDGTKVGGLPRVPVEEGSNIVTVFLPEDLEPGAYCLRLFWSANTAINVWSGTFWNVAFDARRWTRYR